MAAAKENIVIDVTVDTGDATNSISNIEDKIEKLTEQRNELKIGTAAFEKVSREIQGLEQDIKGVELQFEALDMEQKMTAGTDAVVGLAGGFMAAQGAASLFGIESESLEKSLQKMAAAMSISMGLRDMANGVIALRKLGGASALARKGIIALNTAMKANPWGALLAVVVAVASAVALFVVNSRNAAKALDVQHQKSLLLNDARKESIKAIAQEKQDLASLVKIAKDETKSKAAREEAIKQINEISPEYLGNITLETVNSEDATIAINKYTDAIEKKARAQAFSQKLAEIEAQILDEELKTMEELKQSGAELSSGWAVQKKLMGQTLGMIAGEVKEVLTFDQILAEQGKKNSDEAIEGLQARKTAVKELMEADKESLLEDEAFVRVRGKQIEATQALIDEQKALRDEMMQLDKIKGSNKFEELKKITALEQEARDERIRQVATTAEIIKDIEKRASSEAAEHSKDVWQQWMDEKKEMTVAQVQEGLQSAQDSVNALSALNDAALSRQLKGLSANDKRREQIERKAFERGKKIQIAMAIISGLQGIVNIWSAQSSIPQPYDIIPRAINTAVLIATTAAQISKIKSTPFAGGGSVSGGGAGASAGAGGVPINNISNTASLVDQQQQEITAQVVVVESDITTTQENVATVSEVSTF